MGLCPSVYVQRRKKFAVSFLIRWFSSSQHPHSLAPLASSHLFQITSVIILQRRLHLTYDKLERAYVVLPNGDLQFHVFGSPSGTAYHGKIVDFEDVAPAERPSAALCRMQIILCLVKRDGNLSTPSFPLAKGDFLAFRCSSSAPPPPPSSQRAYFPTSSAEDMPLMASATWYPQGPSSKKVRNAKSSRHLPLPCGVSQPTRFAHQLCLEEDRLAAGRSLFAIEEIETGHRLAVKVWSSLEEVGISVTNSHLLLLGLVASILDPNGGSYILSGT